MSEFLRCSFNLRFSLVVAAEEAEVEAVAAAEVLVAAAACAPVAGSRRRGACRAVPAWGHVRRHAPVPAAARGRAEDKWRVRDPAAFRAPGRGQAFPAQERGPALLAEELRKAAPGPVAACQGKAPVLHSDLAQADPVEISQVAGQRLVS